MAEKKPMNPTNQPDLAAAVAAAKRANRKKNGDNTAGDEDAPMRGPRERNREVELAEDRMIAEELAEQGERGLLGIGRRMGRS